MVPRSRSRLVADHLGVSLAESVGGSGSAAKSGSRSRSDSGTAEPRTTVEADAATKVGPDAESVATVDEPDGPLSVCLLSYRSNPYSGGQGVYVKYLSRALADLGHSVDVVSGRPYPDLDPDVNLVELPGENVIEAQDRLRAFEPSYLYQPAKLFEWLSVLTGGFPEPYTFGRRAADYLAAHGDRYDVVHDNQSLCYALRDLDLPVVATVHHPITVDRDLDLEGASGFGERLLVKRWYRFLRMQERVVSDLDHVVCVSEAAKRRTVSDFGADPEAVTTVYNGIDTDLFAPRSDVTEHPTRIMTTVSADVPLKGTKHLLRAFARVRERVSEAELVVVGEFDGGSDCRRLVDELGIGDAIETHSEISYDRMVELYATSAVAVVPSLYEGFGLPAGEAMACGVPTVATTGGALPEVVGDAGVLVPPADAEALAEAIADLLDDPERREQLGERGRERIEDVFDWERTARETVAEYARSIDAHS